MDVATIKANRTVAEHETRNRLTDSRRSRPGKRTWGRSVRPVKIPIKAGSRKAFASEPPLDLKGAPTSQML
jgi:hypothetical protein